MPSDNTQFSVPVVDISSYVSGGTDEERAATARTMDHACSTVGFIQVIGHGVPSEVIEGLKGGIDSFFGESLEFKNQYRLPAGVNRGYSPPKAESLSLSAGVEPANRMNDFFEAFNVGSQAADYPGLDLSESDYATNVWPRTDGFRPAIEAHFKEAGRVTRTLTRVFADALGLPTDYFVEHTDHSVDVLRMVNYALPEGSVELDQELTGMGEHTDYGMVTVLWADQVDGLQVVGPDGMWHDVAPMDGALLVNLGDIMGRWTNERWMSTLHRVKPPIVNGTIKRRRSAAFFHDGNADALVQVLPTCVPDGEEPRFPAMTVADNLKAKLAGSRSGKVNTSAGKVTERILAAADGR